MSPNNRYGEKWGPIHGRENYGNIVELDVSNDRINGVQVRSHNFKIVWIQFSSSKIVYEAAGTRGDKQFVPEKFYGCGMNTMFGYSTWHIHWVILVFKCDF